MTPAQRIESQLLTEAFALRGMNLLNRKELYGEHSNTVYDYCHDQFMSDIELYNGISTLLPMAGRERQHGEGVSSEDLGIVLR